MYIFLFIKYLYSRAVLYEMNGRVFILLPTTYRSDSVTKVSILMGWSWNMGVMIRLEKLSNLLSLNKLCVEVLKEGTRKLFSTLFSAAHLLLLASNILRAEFDMSLQSWDFDDDRILTGLKFSCCFGWTTTGRVWGRISISVIFGVILTDFLDVWAEVVLKEVGWLSGTELLPSLWIGMIMMILVILCIWETFTVIKLGSYKKLLDKNYKKTKCFSTVRYIRRVWNCVWNWFWPKSNG